MGVFDQPDNNPNILEHIWELIKTKGPLSEDEVRNLLAPEHFAPTAHQNVLATLKLGATLGLFAESNGLIRNAIDSSGCFQSTLRWVSFNQKLNPISKLMEKAGNFQLAVAWMLTFPINEVPYDFESARVKLINDYGPDYKNWVIPNNVQWGAFVKWIKYLGLTRTIPILTNAKEVDTIFRMDLSNVVLDFVQAVPLQSTIEAREFITDLTNWCPVLPGGLVWAKLPEKSRSRNSSDSETLGIALKYLDAKGKITIKAESDLENRVTFTFSNGSHLRIDLIEPGVPK